MAIVNSSDQQPAYFGDYPHGTDWSAEPPAGSEQDDGDDFTIYGDEIKFMWEYGVVVPLWNEGLVPEDPEWLRRALGLSDSLIADLSQWGREMCALDHGRGATEQAYLDLDQRARALVDRLAHEVGPRLKVVYRPWRVVDRQGR